MFFKTVIKEGEIMQRYFYITACFFVMPLCAMRIDRIAQFCIKSQNKIIDPRLKIQSFINQKIASCPLPEGQFYKKERDALFDLVDSEHGKKISNSEWAQLALQKQNDETEKFRALLNKYFTANDAFLYMEQLHMIHSFDFKGWEDAQKRKFIASFEQKLNKVSVESHSVIKEAQRKYLITQAAWQCVWIYTSGVPGTFCFFL